ncbi:MAG: hypothetical protein QMB20_05040 [Flavobacteriales bacterium]|jgi:hypothetical protein|tara:strand:+ start:493 stop:828 length:336 start_codon:yes stop_codon:yes gene_type:complete
MSTPTIKDVGTFRRKKPKLRGVRLDFRWSVKVEFDEREEVLSDLLAFMRGEDLVLSGFGEESYSGIISTEKTLEALKKKIAKLKEWKESNSEKFNLFRTGKIQWVEDIHFE